MLTASIVFSASINNVKITSRPWTLSWRIEITYRKNNIVRAIHFQQSYMDSSVWHMFCHLIWNHEHVGVIFPPPTWAMDSPLVSGGRTVTSITWAVALEGTVTINLVEGMCKIWSEGRKDDWRCPLLTSHINHKLIFLRFKAQADIQIINISRSHQLNVISNRYLKDI